MRILPATPAVLSRFRSIACITPCLMMALAVTSARAQTPAVNFIAASPIVVVDIGTGANGAFAGHFNNDSKVDFFFSGVANDLPGQLTFADIVLNNGDGTFDDRSTGLDGAVPPVLAADLNGDGITDLVFVSDLATYAGTSDVGAAVAGDFNGDGSIDLAILTSKTLIITLNNGSGSFHPAFTYALPAGSTGFNIAVGDLNGDKKPDLAVISGNGDVTPFFSIGGGAFKKGGTFSAGVSAGFGVIGDVNKDGFGDIALLTSTGVKIMLGSATGAFTPGAAIASYGASFLVLADFNKDGAVDFAVAGNLLSSFVKVYLGNGNGTFQSPFVHGTVDGITSLIAADVYGSGNIDLITSNAANESLNVLRNDGTGHFRGALVSSSPDATGIVAADFNRDGKQDVAVVNTPACKAPCKGTVTVFPGSGKNFFNPPTKYIIGMHGAAIAAGDLNGDGIQDLVITNSTHGDQADTSVLLGNANGTFQPARNFTVGSLSNDAVLIDVNKDGKLDLVEDVGVALGKGDGTFGPLTPFPGFAFDPTMHLAVGDFNGNGTVDAVVVTSGDCSSTFQVLLGNGKGGFTAGQSIFMNGGQPVFSIAAGKLRRTGPLDLVYSTAGGCNAQVGGETFSDVIGLLGSGNGTFATDGISISHGSLYGRPILAGPLVLADFNGDGKTDVGIATAGLFVVSQGNGDGTFLPQTIFPVASSSENFLPQTVPTGIAVADFTGDHRPDVVVTSGLGISRLYNSSGVHLP